jgi:hypothetical protein
MRIDSPLEAGFFNILLSGPPPGNPEIEPESPPVSASQFTREAFKEIARRHGRQQHPRHFS